MKSEQEVGTARRLAAAISAYLLDRTNGPFVSLAATPFDDFVEAWDDEKVFAAIERIAGAHLAPAAPEGAPTGQAAEVLADVKVWKSLHRGGTVFITFYSGESFWSQELTGADVQVLALDWEQRRAAALATPQPVSSDGQDAPDNAPSAARRMEAVEAKGLGGTPLPDGAANVQTASTQSGSEESSRTPVPDAPLAERVAKRRKAEPRTVAMVTCGNCGELVPPAAMCLRCGQTLTDSGSVMQIGSEPSTPVPDAVPPPRPTIGDGPCADCGADCLLWFAPNEIWNAIEQGGLLCPNCFIRRSAPATWELRPLNYAPPEKCECAQPTRSWNPDWKQCLACGGEAAQPTPDAAPRIDAAKEHIRFIAEQENLTFAECSLAESIVWHAKEALNALSGRATPDAEKVAGWIPVAEKLPEPLQDVLLAIPMGRLTDNGRKWHYEVGWLVVPDPQDADGETLFNTEADTYEIENVEAWRPLPAPPEGQ